MTLTDICILLIVLCVVLWAMLAALHRHTVQLKALREELETLLKTFRPDLAGDSGAAEFACRDPEARIADRVFRVRKF